jgi:hypothetical protein
VENFSAGNSAKNDSPSLWEPLVKSVCQGKKVRQWVLGTLGQLDELKASGQPDALMRSGLRHCETFAAIDAHPAGETEPVTAVRIGPDLVFVRLWKESGIQEVIQSLLGARATSATLNGPSISDCVASVLEGRG